MSMAGQRMVDFVERGRYSDEEIAALVAGARGLSLGNIPLSRRPSLAISMSGKSVADTGKDVMFGVPGPAMDDAAIRALGASCPELWLDGRWFPADVSGLHMVLATTLTVAGHDGIPPQTAALLNVEADGVRFMYDRDHTALRFARLTWRAPRRSA